MLDRPEAEITVRGKTVCRHWARISRLEIERENGRYFLRRVVPVIEDETHYSFPAIYRFDGKIFICPENNEANAAPIFEYDAAAGTATRAGTLCAAPLTDAVLFDGFGEWLCFSTREAERRPHHPRRPGLQPPLRRSRRLLRNETRKREILVQRNRAAFSGLAGHALRAAYVQHVRELGRRRRLRLPASAQARDLQDEGNFPPTSSRREKKLTRRSRARKGLT